MLKFRLNMRQIKRVRMAAWALSTEGGGPLEYIRELFSSVFLDFVHFLRIWRFWFNPSPSRFSFFLSFLILLAFLTIPRSSLPPPHSPLSHFICLKTLCITFHASEQQLKLDPNDFNLYFINQPALWALTKSHALTAGVWVPKT